MCSNGGGAPHVDTFEESPGATVPLVEAVVPIVERWAAGKSASEWLLSAPAGGPLRGDQLEAVRGVAQGHRGDRSPRAAGSPPPTRCCSVWLGSGADLKVVQRLLGRRSMTDERRHVRGTQAYRFCSLRLALASTGLVLNGQSQHDHLAGVLPSPRRGICLSQHKVRHYVQRGLDHVSPVGRLAAGGFRRVEEWGQAVSGDHIADEHGRSEQRSIDG
jgi:hypothetical protein